MRKPRRGFLAPGVLGLFLGAAAILCVGAAVLWLSGPAESLVLVGLSVVLLVLAAFLVVFLIVHSERSSGWSGQMRIIALYWAIIPAMTFFSLYNRFEHPAAIVIAIYCGFILTIWLGLHGVSSAARIAPKYRLLLLRSFPKQPKKTIIYPLINNWAYLGEVLMLAGPDLAGITLGPSEIGRFLTGRIRRNFIHDEAELDKKLTLVNRPSYRDGRYRILEFACMSDTWVQTFRHLISLADTVLLDLREFDTSHQGAAFELEEIATNEDMRHRTIVVTNDATDFGLVDRIIRGALVSLPLEDGPRIVRVGYGNDREVVTLLRLLTQAAESAHPV